MCHLQSLPGNPYYDADGGMEKVMAAAKTDFLALQEDGADGIMFSNEFSPPYLTKVEPVAIAAMVRVIGELRPLITVPCGVNCLWNPTASVDLTVTVDGKFIREIISGVYVSDFGLWDANVGKTVRHEMAVGAKDLGLLFNIVPEAARYPADRDIEDIARSAKFNSRPDTLYVSGLTAGSKTDTQILGQIETSVKHTPVPCNTGCNVNNITKRLPIADGAVCATTFRYGGVFENAINVRRVKRFMDKVKEYRATLQDVQMTGMNFKTRLKSGILRKQGLWYAKGIF